MDYERIEYELKVLKAWNNPSWIEVSDDGRWVYAYTGENGFTLHIDVSNFPYAPPPVFIDRMLYDRRGNALDSPSHASHTLQAQNGKTQICYYRPSRWISDESLLMVYRLGVVWCQAYWKWLATGLETIDYWIDEIRNGNCI